jgi:hypothetical protein
MVEAVVGKDKYQQGGARMLYWRCTKCAYVQVIEEWRSSFDKILHCTT